MEVTKLVEGCFISDLALVSSPEVACGFRYDSKHRVLSSPCGKCYFRPWLNEDRRKHSDVIVIM